MKVFAVLTAWALWVLPLLSLAEGVRYRGIFVNDEDWGLRPWAVRHFGAEEQIGTNAYAEIFALMKANGLNLIWPAMHEGGYEFSARPENLELARHWGITVGTSHCEPMLRNNCYLAKADKKKWSWVSNRDFLIEYWKEGVRRGTGNGDVLWTIGMRGIHDGRMPDGKTTQEKIKILEEVFAAQCALLPDGAPKLFCPYKEVLPIFNAGLKVPKDATIMWTNDNFGYVRRVGGPQCEGYGGGIYWHLSYHGSPHGYIHLCTTPPAFMWYELVAKCWENGVRDVWMVNAGDVFQAEILLDAFGRFAADPDSWGPDAQVRFLSSWATTFLSSRVGKSDVGCPKSDVLAKRIAAHLAEYCNLGFNRKPEHMCVQWSRNLPESVKASLLKRYYDLLNEDMAIERFLHDSTRSTRSTRLKIADEYFRLVGFQARFLAYAGIIHLEGRDKDYARSVIDPLYERWDKLDGGKWSSFWCDTIDENGGMRQPTTHNRWSSQMQWPWNEPDDPERKDRRGESRNDYVATAYAWERAKGLEEPTWIEPVAREHGAKGGEWVNVAGLGTSGNALALLPVKPGVGDGALLKFDLNHLPTHSNTHPLNQSSLVLQFLPDFALWPGLKLGVKVSFDDGEAKYVEVQRSDSNIGEKDSVRAVAVQDNFIRVDVPIPSGAKTATITAVDPGVVIDRVGVRPTRQASGSGERIIPQGANVAPNGDRLEVTSKCLRLNGRALIPIMGEMHYSRVPRDEWAKSLATMKAGGVSIVSTYVFWNHHEWKEGEWDFSGNRDLSAFLREVKNVGLWAVVRIGPWAHGECREGGFPDWLVDKGLEWANGDAKKARQILRSRDARFLGETKKLFERVHSEVAPHLWKNGGPVIGIQLENESRGPWPYYQALKKLAVDAGFDVPMYTRTGWPRLNGPETTFGEMIPLYGDYAEGFWDRELKSMPGSYKDAFAMRPARTSSVIATEQLGAQKAEDANGAEKYPYFTCELGGGMASSYHRRLVMEPMDAFALAVVKLGSGSNLPGFYMYHGGSNPTEYGVNMAESQRGRFTNYNDLPVVSYEFMAPISEFGEPQYAYWMIKALADFCRENAEELAVAEPVFVNKNETRRGRFIFHNDYVRRLKPDGECWIGVEKDGRIERLVDGRLLVNAEAQRRRERREKTTAMCVESLKVLKPAGTPPPVAVGPNGVAMPPEESAWDAAAEYEVPFKSGDTMLEIAYVGDMARLYADGVLVQDDFWKGRPIRYALRRLPAGTKRLVLKVLPWGEGVRDKIYVDAAAGKPVACAPLLSGGNPDPTICRVGEDYYIATSSFSLSPGLPVYRSKDMVNWEIISHAWREPWPCKTPDDGIWAPTLRHHNGVFYLTVTWHDGFKKAENYLLTARDPAGPWSKPMKIDAKSGIDGSLFFDGDDAWYLSNQQPSKQKWRNHCQIWMQRIDLATGRLFGERHVLTDGFGEGAAFAEGPHLYKIGGKYLLLHAQGGTAWGHMEIALVSDCVTGPYTHVAGNPVLTAKDWGRSSPLQAFGHADLVQMPDGEWRAVFLGMRMADEGKKCPLGRETFSCRVDLDGDGLPTRFRRDELIAGDWTDPAQTRYALLDRPHDSARYVKVRDLAGRVDYPDKPFRFCAALAVEAPPRRAIRLRVADEQKSAGMRETLSLDGEWSFEVTGGRRAGEKTTITVPSCWETQGFGTWQYGYNIEFGDKWHGHEKPADEHGLYSRTFTVPSEWRGKCVKLRFEGVMTEANVKVNGKVFPPHHSAWFPFEFDISDLVNYGGENTLEVDCGKESSDASVNRSERRCDFWNYGGIFRSVSLRAVPKLHIECVRIDARADGTLHAVVRASDGREETIDEKWTNIETWDVDHPKLYERVFELKDENGNVVDSVTKRFGFRTVEVRPRDGVYVNGKKIVVKGVNRQTFNARTGRALTREMNYEDARLIKSLNMNAVRIAHLTADEAFLDACDELGIYVEDEFCSWQKPIRTELGREYLKVFLERDHNHPSVIFWSNGNEGGWNTELDAMFKEIDLQKRAVLHPWAFHDGIDTKHYPDYDRLVKKLKTGELFMPTEFQHGLYDGGLGAGLEDFWTTMMRYPNGVGGFLWALKDEAQWRDDLGRYDACGNLAPDGLVGPNGEEGGSCATVRAIFGGEGDGEMQDEPPRRGGGEFTIPEPRLIAWRLVGETKGSRYEPVEASFEWTVTTNADASVTYAWTISCTNAVDVLGVDFPFSARDAQLVSKRWCGRGPDRIWRNRMRGPKWGVWEDVYNDAVPGVSWERPFKGWFEAKWMEVAVGASGKEASHILCIPGEGLYMGVGSPKDGPDNYLYAMPYELGVGVYHVIPAIGNKLFKAERGGPQGRLVRLVEGRVSGSVELRL